MINRTALCNCRIEVEDNFLLQFIAACPGKQSALTMYFTVNTAFMHYFCSLTNNLETHILQNWTMHEQVQPISLQKGNSDIKHSFFNNYIMDVFLFIATILSMITTVAILCITYKHAKLKALLTGITFQPIRQQMLYLAMKMNIANVQHNGRQ